MGREGRCRQISLARVGSTCSVPATLGLPPTHGVCFPRLHCSGSRLLYRERALSCVQFQFWVLHKKADSFGPAFCAFPGRAAQAPRSLRSALSLGCSVPYPLCSPSFSFREHQLGVPCVCSGELVSSRNTPSRCQPSINSGSLWLETGSLFAVW